MPGGDVRPTCDVIMRRIQPSVLASVRRVVQRASCKLSDRGHDDLVTTARTYTHVVADERELDYAELLV